MITVNVTEFKSHCLKLMQDANSTGETIRVTKRGKPFATVIPESPEGDYRPGKFKDVVKIVGDIMVDGQELGIEWETIQ